MKPKSIRISLLNSNQVICDNFSCDSMIIRKNGFSYEVVKIINCKQVWCKEYENQDKGIGRFWREVKKMKGSKFWLVK